MLRMTVSKSAEAAKRYFETGFAREDYFSEGKKIVGRWGGKGAERLGLVGPVEAKAFEALCDNLQPSSGERLTRRTKRNRRVGYDLNFHPPKSVSVLHAFGDRRIAPVFQEAVRETMQELERETRTRVRANGANTNRVTGNLVWAEFIHETTRPVQSVPDPHLHAHCYTLNATYDEVEGCWKAGQYGEINVEVQFYEAIFLNKLSRKLQQLGYSITKRGRSFEVDGVPLSVNEKFSRRTKLIEQVAKKLGLVDKTAKAKLGAATRERKNDRYTPEQVLKIWREMLTAEELQVIDALIARPGMPIQKQDTPNERAHSREQAEKSRFPLRLPAGAAWTRAEEEAIQFAILHCFERASVVTERKLLEAALRFGLERVELERLEAALAVERPDLLRRTVDGKVLVTTPAVLREEQFIVRWVKDGRNARLPLWRDTWCATGD